MHALLRLLPIVQVTVLTAPVLAQGAPKAPSSDGWIAVVIALVLIIAVCVATFMSAKRTHQD